MSLSKWKELADRKAKTGEMKRNLFDEITEEKIRSKTTDQAIAKTFRLGRLDQIAEQTKPKPRRRTQIPRINRDGGIDYAPEVEPYEDMDVEGLLNLEDYVAPQAEKQIAKIPKKAPKYEMDPSFWELGDPPLTYEDIFEEKEPLAIEGPPPDDDDDDDVDEFVDAEEGDDDDVVEEANKILDQLDLPNYNDVDLILDQPEMTATKQRNYLKKVINDAETRRKTVTIRKSNAKRAYKKGDINKEQKKLIFKNVGKLEKNIADYKEHYKSLLNRITGSGVRRGQRGKGAYFFNDAKEMLQKLTLIIAEMEAGNTSIKMRNMGQTILDALLHAKHLNKQQYGQLVKKYFAL